MQVNGLNSIDKIKEDWAKYGGDTVANITDENGLFVLEEEDGDVFTKVGGQWVQAGNATSTDPETRKQQLEQFKAKFENRDKKNN